MSVVTILAPPMQPPAATAVQFEGTSGNQFSASCTAITGDIDIRAAIALSDLTPSSRQWLLARWTASGNNRSYALGIETTGVPTLWWSTDGSNSVTADCSATLGSVGAVEGSIIAVRATLDVVNGVTNREIRFFYKTTTPTSAFTDIDSNTGWTALGSTINVVGTTSINGGTAALRMGNASDGGHMVGKFYAGSVKQGIAGTRIASPNCAAITGARRGRTTPSSFADSDTNTWTATGTAWRYA